MNSAAVSLPVLSASAHVEASSKLSKGDSEEATGAQFFPCQLVLTCLRALNVNGPAARP